MLGDLTTLERAKAWLAPDQGVLTTQNDVMIARLVTSVSRLAMNCMGRDTLARTVRTETYRGGRTSVLVLRTWPVISVGSVALAPITTPLAAGDYSLEPIRPAGGSQRLYLGNGRTFMASGPAGVGITYTTGFVTTERLTADDDASAPKVSTSMCWLADEGVTTPDGTPITPYTVADGLYTLPAAQAGQDVLVTYSYVPPDIEQAVISEVGMTVRSRAHIGESSKALPGGGGTQSYLPVALSDLTKLALQNYARVVPQ